MSQAHLLAIDPEQLDTYYQADCQVDSDHVSKLQQYISKRKYTIDRYIPDTQTKEQLQNSNNLLDHQSDELNKFDLQVKVGGLFDFKLNQQKKSEEQIIFDLLNQCDQKMNQLNLDEMLFNSWFFSPQHGASQLSNNNHNNLVSGQMKQNKTSLLKSANRNGFIKANVDPLPMRCMYHQFICTAYVIQNQQNQQHNSTSSCEDNNNVQNNTNQFRLNQTDLVVNGNNNGDKHCMQNLMDADDSSINNQSSLLSNQMLISQRQTNAEQKDTNASCFYLILPEPLPHDVIQISNHNANNAVGKSNNYHNNNQQLQQYQVGSGYLNNNNNNNSNSIYSVEAIMSKQEQLQQSSNHADTTNTVEQANNGGTKSEQVLIKMCARYSKKTVSLDSTAFYYQVNVPVQKNATYNIYFPKTNTIR